MGKSVYRAFADDIASDAVAKWSGGGGIVFVVLAAVFPWLASSLRPFLWLGVVCFFVASVRAWAVEHRKTQAQYVVLNDHPRRSQRFYVSDEGTVDYQRVWLLNTGVESILDARVRIRQFGGVLQQDNIDCVPTGTKQGEEATTLYHDIPQGFDLFTYRFPERTLHFQGRNGVPDVRFSLDLCPEVFELVFSVAGKNVPTEHYAATIIRQADTVFAANAFLIKNARTEIHFAPSRIETISPRLPDAKL
ncbi:MAG: hypothetical protein M3041_12145 [Acidobacteriota bacterium]|nr:hypothetical protein [Acidobacteriota bacterium]